MSRGVNRRSFLRQAALACAAVPRAFSAARALAVALACGPRVAGAQAGAPAARFFPARDLMRVGVYYYPEHWPESRRSRPR